MSEGNVLMINAVTEDGRSVMLGDDGSWQFAVRESQSAPQGGFAGIPWGTAYAAVLDHKAEDEWFGSSEDVKFSRIYLNGWSFQSAYEFTRGMLARGTYVLDPEATIVPPESLYRTFAEALRAKYGEPEHMTVLQGGVLMERELRSLTDDEFDELTVIESWSTPDTSIQLTFFGNLATDDEDFDDDDYSDSPGLTIVYESIALQSLSETDKREEFLGQL